MVKCATLKTNTATAKNESKINSPIIDAIISAVRERIKNAARVNSEKAAAYAVQVAN